VIYDYIIPAVFIIGILIQLVYLLFVFTTFIRHKDAGESESFPGISIIVAAWNELENLNELLPILDNQDYPDFEVIVVDDRSSDGTYDYLRTNEGGFKHVKFVYVKALPDHFTAKKYALTIGIKKASKEFVLLTDADCRPASDQWAKQMASQIGEDKELVFGFSPYFKHPGFLNLFIRYETFQTALQYLSFSKVGVPFMGVGRNLLYRRETFWKANGFTSHMSLLSGDDDLLVNEIANSNNTSICTNPDAFVWSEPKHTFKEWVTQKKRHLSVGKKYKLKNKVTIGLLWLSFLICWLMVLPAIFSEPTWFVLPEWMRVPNELLLPYGIQQYEPVTNWMRLIIGIFLGWQLLRWLILHLANRKTGSTFNSGKILFLDFCYFAYLIVFGILTLFSNPQKIKWR
jgi:cellulose synthase/poly-beta-1,6-N-acetylglucosamine synthase-like glycosyltransferase